jgi:hypothetical protein
VRRARRPAWERDQGYDEIASRTEHQRRVPVGEYLDFSLLWRRALWGEADTHLACHVRRFTRPSGTTSGDQSIPVTTDAVRHHRRSGLDTLLFAFERSGADLLGGSLLFLGGSTRLEPVGEALRERPFGKSSAGIPRPGFGDGIRPAPTSPPGRSL